MNTKYTWKNLFFYTSVFLFAVSLPFSEFMISLSSGLLVISCIVTGGFQEKFNKLKNQPAALLIISVFFVYVIGVIFTRNMPLALYELQKTAFILVVPLCIAIGPPIGYTMFWKVLLAFMAALNLASAIAIFRLIFREQFGIHDIWEILFVSHIGFSFQLLLGISILINERYNQKPIGKNLRYIMIADILYLLVFLFLLKSLTGLATFAVLLVIHLFFVIRKIKIRKWKLFASIMLPAMILGGFFYLGSCVYRFYDTAPIDPAQLPERTQNGNLYKHDLNDKMLENGNYVGLYLSWDELKESWAKRSLMALIKMAQMDFMFLLP